MNTTITSSDAAATPRLAQLSTQELELTGGTVMMVYVGLIEAASGSGMLAIPGMEGVGAGLLVLGVGTYFSALNP